MSAYRRSAILSGIALTAALTLTACGGDDGGTAGPSSPSAPAAGAPTTAHTAHNAADVTFAQGMIPHHRQAVEMAGLADGRASAAEVKALATKIKQAQAPEIETLSGWLRSWGEPAPADDAGGHGGHGGTAGMMTEEDMNRLKNASGKAFDTAFLEMMIEHHEGAVQMARTEQAQGAHPPAKELARTIETTQTAEIAQMRRLLGR